MSDPTFGLMFHRTRNRWADFDSIEVRVQIRRSGEDSSGVWKSVPDSVAHWWPLDKMANGKPVPYLKDLIMPSCVYVTDRDSVVRFSVEAPRFRPIYTEDILAGTAKGMADTLLKIEKQFQKDSAWGEHGDKLMSLARAVGAQWICSPRTESGKIDDTWDRVRWNWFSISEGRNAYRCAVECLVCEEQAKIVAAKAPITDDAQAA